MRALVVVSLLVTMSAAAQQQPALSEKVEVRLLEINAVVTDRDGKPVHGLTAADFEVLEDGKPQQVTNLSEYRETATTSAESPTPAAAPRAVGKPAPRTLVLLLDAIQLRGRPRTEFFDQLRALVDRTVRPGDRVMILTWIESAFRPTLELTTDRAAIRNALTTAEKTPAAMARGGMTIHSHEARLKKMEEVSTQTAGGGMRGPQTSVAAPFEQEDLELEKRLQANEELGEMKAKTASMRGIVASVPNPDGRTVAVFASEQFSRIAGKRAFIGTRSAGAGQFSFDEAGFNTTRLIASVVSAANANGIAFYAVHPEIRSSLGEFHSIDDEQVIADHTLNLPPGQVGTQAMTDQQLLQNDIDALQHLASETGGTIGVGASGVKEVVEQIAADLGSYYSLGWHARSDGSDRERRIKVRTKNPNYIVRTRATLVEKSDKTRAEDLLIAQLFERGSAGDLEVGVDVKSSSRVELTIPVDQLAFKEEQAKFTVMIAAARGGERTDIRRDTRSIKNTRDGIVRYTVSLDAKSGVVAIGVLDEHSGEVGIRTIDVAADGTATVSTPPPSSIANAAWREAFDKSLRHRKPLVVFFRPKRCPRCDTFESSSLTHPAIAQRASNAVFGVVSWSGMPPSVWTSTKPGVGIFDPAGTLRAQWSGVPDTMTLGRILDGAAASAVNFQRAAALTKSGGPYAGAIEHAVGLQKLGLNAEARALLDEVATKGDPLQQQRAIVTLAPLNAREGNVPEAMAALARVRAEPVNDQIAAEAAFHFAVLSRHLGSDAEAHEAFRAAVALGGADSPVGRAADAELRRLSGAIGIVPFPTEVISGLQTVRTMVRSPLVARVVFTVDGKDVATVTKPPFSTPIQFGRLPQAHRVRAVAYDAAGTELGRDEMAVNAAGNVFWVRLTDPVPGNATGATPVSVELRAPANRRVTSVALSWNDEPVSTLTSEPWRSVARIPNEVGVLRVTATLDDGRTAEDAVLLNGSGVGERMDVQLVHLPVTVMPPRNLTPADVVVREGETRHAVEAIRPGSELPLYVGLVIDTSSSMQNHLDEVQEAALRFLDSTLGASDRAFLISFDSAARLVTTTTGDKQLLRQSLLRLLPNGYTALHDAIVLGLLQMEGVEGRRALLVFTDGDDTASRYSAADVAELSRRSNVPIYLIAPQLEARDVVKAARTSGGHVYELTDITKINAIYDAIAEALRAQMLVTIRRAGAAGQHEWREIKVDVAGKDVTVRAPAGYYAPR